MTIGKRLILALGAVVAVGPLSIDMYLPALPSLQTFFATDAVAVHLTLAAFFAGIAFGQLLYGPLSDRYGRRAPLIWGLTGYIMASLGCAFAESIESLILWRFLQAMSGCAGMVVSRAVVRDLCSPQEMAKVLSLLVLVMGVAPILAPFLGSIVLTFLDWRALFLILALFGAICLLAAVFLVPESMPIQQRETRLSLLSAWRNYRHVVSHRRFLGYALSGGIAQAGMFAYISASAFVFIGEYGMPADRFAILFGVNAFGLILASQVNRAILARYPAQRVLGHALGLYSIAALVLVVNIATGLGGVWGAIAPLWLCLACLGFTFPNSTAAAMAPFGDRAGSASAMLGTMQFTVAGLASAAVGMFEGHGGLPMAVVMAGCACTAWLVLRWVRVQP